MEPPLRDTQLTRTSPCAVLAGLSIVSVVAAVVFTFSVAGPRTMPLPGVPASIVQVRLAGEASVLPAASVALTWNVCPPVDKLEYAFGELQVLKLPPSRAHSNVDPSSLEEKVNDALVDVEVGGSEVIVVCGGVVSTLHV
jgi:hypothetical protein